MAIGNVPFGAYKVNDRQYCLLYTSWRVLLDKEFKAKLKIVKKDDETKKSVLIAGTEVKVYDLDNKKDVEQVTTYPVTTTNKSYFTDSQGCLLYTSRCV